MIALALLAGSSAAASPIITLTDVAGLIQPYVECRQSADRRVVVLQQQLQAKRKDDPAYDYASDPVYWEIKTEVLDAESKCDVWKYVGRLKTSIEFSKSYDDIQKNIMARNLIEDVIHFQWTFLNAQNGTYDVPRVTVVSPDGTKNNAPKP